MPNPTISAAQLKAVAQHYELPWPPPKEVAEIERARKAAMLRHHPDRGGTAEAAQQVNQWFDLVRAIREGKVGVAQRPPGVPGMPGMPGGVRFEIPMVELVNAIFQGRPIPPPRVQAEQAGTGDGDFVFRVHFDFGGPRRGSS